MRRLPSLLLTPVLALAPLLLAACSEEEPTFTDAGMIDADTTDGADLTAPETTLLAAPADPSNQDPARFEFTADRPATFRCQLDDGAAVECTSPYEVTVGEGARTFAVHAVSVTGVADATPATHAWVVDLTPPDTTITEAPAALDNSVDVSLAFEADEDATFTCAVDGGAAAPCTSPLALTGLADGPHSVVITATDRAGNVEVEPARHDWVLDSAAPDTVIDSGPTGLVTTAAATFTFSSPDAGPGATFACSLDGAAFAACASPRAYSGLAEGDHTFAVRVTDATGNVDPTPAQRSWTVDTVAPTVTLGANPSLTSDRRPTFGFTTAGGPTQYFCRINTTASGAFTACTSATSHQPASNLADGAYVLSVYVRDAAGNQSPTVDHPFSIDGTPPTVSIGQNPQLTNQRRPVLQFVTTDNPTQFFCRISPTASGPFTACSTPTTYQPASDLADGGHVFSVYVRDAAGNTSATASFSFSVDATVPTVAVSPQSPVLVNYRRPTFAFSVTDNPNQFYCRIGPVGGGGPFSTCSTTANHTPSADLADGAYTLAVYVRDPAGNQSATATHDFTVDATAPTVVMGQNASLFNVRRPVINFIPGGNPTIFRCRFGTAPFSACTTSSTHQSLTNMADGAYTFEVYVQDAASNTSATASFQFQIDATAPTVSVSGPATTVYTTTTIFRWTVNEAINQTGCRSYARGFPSGGYGSCSSGGAWPVGPGTGEWTFEVRVRDAAGNYGYGYFNYTTGVLG